MENVTKCPTSIANLLNEISGILRKEPTAQEYKMPDLEDLEDKGFFTVEEIVSTFADMDSRNKILKVFRNRGESGHKPVMHIFTYLKKLVELTSGDGISQPVPVQARSSHIDIEIDHVNSDGQLHDNASTPPATPSPPGDPDDYTPIGGSPVDAKPETPQQPQPLIIQPDPYSFSYSSKSSTGCVGLRNQGATCYLNSLIQTLMHLTYFRKAIYDMPIGDDEDPTKSIPFALQKLFYHLQTSEEAPSTKFLTKSFGWSGADTATQHDIQEFMRVLFDSLSERFKKIDPNPHTNVIMKLFKGELLNYVKCTDIQYESRRIEEIYDINLVVKGTGSIQAAMDLYVKEDILDGDNMYEVEKDGKKEKHPACKGCRFKKLPPVLMIHLRRFDFDLETLRQCKVNDRFEFDEEIDLSPYVEPRLGWPRAGSAGRDDELPRSGTNDSFSSRNGTFYLDPEEKQVYVLHSVMVHSGTIYGGHYVCYVKPDPSKGWLKFDDSVVSHATYEEAITNNYGGDTVTSYGYTRENTSNAYLLTYVRKQLIDLITKPISGDFAELRERIEKAEEKERREENELRDAPNYYKVSLLTQDEVTEHSKEKIGGIGGAELVKADRVFKIKKTKLVVDLEHEVGTMLGRERPRLWRVTPESVRFDYPEVTVAGDSNRVLIESLGHISAYATAPKDTLLFASYCERADPGTTEAEGVVFFKLFDSEKSEFRMVSHRTCVLGGTTYNELHAWLVGQTGGAQEGEGFAMFHEKSDRMVCPVKAEDMERPVFESFPPTHHKILILQRYRSEEERLYLLSDEKGEGLKAPTVFYETLHKVTLKVLPYPFDDEDIDEEAALSITALSIENVGDIVSRIAAALTPPADPSHLRIHMHSAMEGRPRQAIRNYEYKHPISYNLTQNVANTFYYERISMSLGDLESKTEMAVKVQDRGVILGQYRIVLDDDCYTDSKEVIDMVLGRHREAVGEGNANDDPVLVTDPTELCLLADSSRSTIERVYRYDPPATLNTNLLRWRVERLPKRVEGVGEADQSMVHVYRLVVGRSFNKDDYEFHGQGFLLYFAHSETAQEVWERIRGHLGLADGIEQDSEKQWPLYVTNEHEYVRLSPQDNVHQAMVNLRSEWFASSEVVLALEMPVSKKESDAKRRRLLHTRQRVNYEPAVRFKNH
eukprot:TRINITY_DN10167_c0_g1_i1.p1 TRINITY_DN10167_c0_g1~~TRINITY_DN10167_c0_g1_i1.p1  ORF type:complete len:1163 (+),score=390.06 TRINITY_DN10167_c0_g1_i1:64-3552(+)